MRSNKSNLPPMLGGPSCPPKDITDRSATDPLEGTPFLIEGHGPDSSFVEEPVANASLLLTRTIRLRNLPPHSVGRHRACRPVTGVRMPTYSRGDADLRWVVWAMERTTQEEPRKRSRGVATIVFVSLRPFFECSNEIPLRACALLDSTRQPRTAPNPRRRSALLCAIRSLWPAPSCPTSSRFPKRIPAANGIG